MRTLPLLACVSLVALLAACGPSDGYYDADGHYIYYNTPAENSAPPEHDTTHNRAWHGVRDGETQERRLENGRHGRYADEVYGYDRRGYYDDTGHYVSDNEASFTIPERMFPSPGMCRVWFTDRSPAHQPAAMPCRRLRTPVPAGAYVIYGG